MAKENTRIQISDKYWSTQWKPFALPKAGPEKYYNEVWEGSTQKFTDHLSIGNWVLYKGSFNNYVDKMRGRRGKKVSVFVHAQGIKTVHAGGGAKKGKILST